MASVTPDNAKSTTPENRGEKNIPGRIGVYERPQGPSRLMIFAGIIGLILLIILAVLLFVMLL